MLLFVGVSVLETCLPDQLMQWRSVNLLAYLTRVDCGQQYVLSHLPCHQPALLPNNTFQLCWTTEKILDFNLCFVSYLLFLICVLVLILFQDFLNS